jgi:Bifunctional DNA primase/polymerase, N-terminal
MARPDPDTTAARPPSRATTTYADPAPAQGAEVVSSVADVLGQALAYAAAGWPVFPVRPDTPECPGGQGCQCKAPYLGSRGCRGASASPRLIRAWWQARPDANLAIATGSPGPDVLDVDVKPDGTGFPAFNRLAAAGLLAGALALVRTPSGGLHAYYRGTGQPNGKLAKHHLDFRGDGGYVLAPPSRVHGRAYELLSHRPGAGGRIDWQAVKQLLEPAPARPRSRRAGSLRSLAGWVEHLHEGDRNDGLFWAACRAAESGHDDLGALADAAVRAGLSEAEARRTVASAARKAAR